MTYLILKYLYLAYNSKTVTWLKKLISELKTTTKHIV